MTSKMQVRGLAAAAKVAGLGLALTLALGTGSVAGAEELATAPERGGEQALVCVEPADDSPEASEEASSGADGTAVTAPDGSASPEVAPVEAEKPEAAEREVPETEAPKPAATEPEGADAEAAEREAEVEKTDEAPAEHVSSTNEASQAASEATAEDVQPTLTPDATTDASGEAAATAKASTQAPATAKASTQAPATAKASTQASSSGIVDKMNVYRLYNPRNGEHLYTKDLYEATTIASSRGWQWEGVGFTASASKGQAVWRLCDTSTGLHLWTTDAWERHVLLTERTGWSDEGLAWYGAGPYRMSRLYDPKTQQHLYTRDANEVRVLTTQRGWTLEAGAGTWSTGSASDYVPIVARWLASDSWGEEGGRYWIQGDGSIAKNRMVYAGEGAGYNAYATSTGAVVRNRHINFADGVYSADNVGRLTKANWLQGIDIFSGQGSMNTANVDADFVIVKATQGTQYTNPYYISQANGALGANKLLGFYHYASTNWGGGDPIAEADYFVSRVQTYAGRAVLVLDWEGGDDGTNDNFGKNDAWYAKTFLDRVYQRTGIKGLLYINKGTAVSKDWSSVANAGYELWVAQYLFYSGRNQAQGYVAEPMTTHSSLTWKSPMTGAWKTPIMYQYTCEGHVAGYSGGELDLNKFYGTSDLWKKLASKR